MRPAGKSSAARVAYILARLRQERIAEPQLPVEAPVTLVNQKWEGLP